MNNKESLLAVRGLSVHFSSEDGPVKAVNNVSFDLNAGEVLGIVGESGSGKSATGLSLMGLIPSPPGKIVSGSITYGGTDLTKLSEAEMTKIRGRQISMVFQDPMTSLNPYLTVERQLTEILEVHEKLPRNQAITRAIDLLARVGIRDAAKRIYQYPHQFSGGMRQRVVIAMALLCKPSLIIADEPTTALDVTVQSQILELLADLVRVEKTAVIIITHDLGVVSQLADKVAVMYAGRFVEQGTTEEVLAAPAHPYTKGLLTSIPRLDLDDAHRLQAIPGLPPRLSRLPVGCAFSPRCSLSQEACDKRFPDPVELSSTHSTRCVVVKEGM